MKQRRAGAGRPTYVYSAVLALTAAMLLFSACTSVPAEVPAAMPATTGVGSTTGSAKSTDSSGTTSSETTISTAAVDPAESLIPRISSSIISGTASAGPAVTDNGQPAHVPSIEELRAPIIGDIDRAALHGQALQILGTETGDTYENELSVFNEWNTGSSESFLQLGDPKFYHFDFTTLENEDGTLTNARCTVAMPGRLPLSSPDDWPPLFDLCVDLQYRDADPGPVRAWAKDALKQLQATEPGPTPVFQQVNLNCLHWQLGWVEEVRTEGGYEESVGLDVSTGFSTMTPDGGYAGSGDHPTAYGCPA